MDIKDFKVGLIDLALAGFSFDHILGNTWRGYTHRVVAKNERLMLWIFTWRDDMPIYGMTFTLGELIEIIDENWNKKSTKVNGRALMHMLRERL